MPSLRRKIRSPYFYACFTLPDGRRVQRSTKKTKKKEALAVAMEWEKASVNRYSEAQFRRVLSEIHEGVHGKALSLPTLRKYADDWLERKRGELASTSFSAYSLAIQQFVREMKQVSEQPIHYVTADTIRAWRDRSSKSVSPRTANNKLKYVRGMFADAKRDGLLIDNPAEKVMTLKADDAVRREFTHSQIRAILSVATGEWKGMILVGLYTGQRLKDIACLTWANVDLEQSEIRLQTSKTGRHQVIPIAEPLREYFTGLEVGDDPTAPMFPKSCRIAQKNQHAGGLSNQFARSLAAAGLRKPVASAHVGTGKGRSAPRVRNELSFHSLRHTATSLLKASGVSEAVAMDIIGHDSSAVSRHYTHTNEADKRAAIATLPDVTKGVARG